MTDRIFYRTVIEVEILSENPIPDNMSLAEIEYEINEGSCSGTTTTVSNQVVNGEEMAKLLRKQGSDPEFFWIGKYGEELDDLYD